MALSAIFRRLLGTAITNRKEAETACDSIDAVATASTAATAALLQTPVALTTGTTIAPATHNRKRILLNSATGFASTLPAATGSGAIYRFFVQTAPSSGSHTIVANGAYLFGSVAVGDDTGVATLFTNRLATSAAGSTTITLNGGTTGGRKGDWITVEDVAINTWAVSGQLNASGTEATPFS